jgi:hypothetical protein
MTIDHNWQDDLNDLKRRVLTLEDRISLQSREIIHEAVLTAQRDTFAKICVDVDDPKSLGEFQRQLMFSATLEKYVSKGVLAFFLAVCGAVGTAIVAVVWDRFRRGE